MNELLCDWDIAKFFVFSGNIFEPGIYYYHLFPFFVSLGIGIFVFLHNSKGVINRLFLIIILLFDFWVFASLLIWANEKQELIMFFWSVLNIAEPLIYAGSLYFVYLFLNKKDMPLLSKIVIGVLFLPVLIFASTKYNLSGFDFTNCDREAVEGPLPIYGYLIEIIYTFWMFFIFLYAFKNKLSRHEKIQTILLLVGISSFLVLFSLGNLIGNFTDNWNYALYGMLGMPIFIGFLGYLIVKHHMFNLKLFATQALVWALAIMIGAQYFFIKVPVNFVLNTVTFITVIVLGRFLIKSVKVEIEQKEKLQHLTEKLEDANVKLQALDKLKSEFISLASHQLRSPLTVIKGYAATLTDGIAGDLTEKQTEVVRHIYVSAQGLANVVEDFLNVTKIEQGGMKYVFASTDMRTIVDDLASDMRITAEAKHLEFQTDINEGVFMVNADGTKMKQVFLNLIDNSIKYTKEGFVKVWLHKTQDEHGKDMMKFGVSDSGVGVSEETKAKLFQKFGRGEGAVMNGGGSGLGLYLAQEIVKAHGGEIIIDSEGLGKGATFSVTLPLISN